MRLSESRHLGSNPSPPARIFKKRSAYKNSESRTAAGRRDRAFSRVMKNSPRGKKKTDWEYFDDCDICKAMGQAEQQGRSLGERELKAAFQKANRKTNVGTFIFETKILGYKNLSRTLAVPSNCNLYELAEIILAAYKFNFDHAFGFFSDVTEDNYFESERKYELFTDLIQEGQDLEPTGADSVKDTLISDVWHAIGDKMMFLFDYGDDWRFEVKLIEFGDKIPAPTLLKSIGKTPKQY